jgi:Nicotinic acid phosphoribosyltransferase
MAGSVAAAATPRGADETTPSRSQYFSWINNTNEGPTEAHTLANLAFFRWLHDEYGLKLDLYAFDAGAIDGKNFYGSTKSERFRRQFPRGFGPVAKEAAEMGTRLGVWGGPDGFGDTPEEEAARIEDMVSLCRDFGFELFKMDAVCGQLRPEKYDAFDRMMTACREHSPNLILLNHRLDLGPAVRHSTTFLLGGAETYIDVHMANETSASHARAVALARELPPNLTRLTEDHGVCLSSCLDYWEDDLVLQAFNRSLVLAPQIYGNPWLLRDDEFPRLAGIFNLHRRYRDILVSGIVLPGEAYGPHAVSRGDGYTRLITLRNLTWEKKSYTVSLDASIGLEDSGSNVRVRQLHPWQETIGQFEMGGAATVEVLPFRSCLVEVTTAPRAPWEIDGIAYEVVRDVPGRPVEIRLLGEPGERAKAVLRGEDAKFSRAMVDGEDTAALVRGDEVEIAFAGEARREPWHRRVATLEKVEVPADAQALYEAMCFAADNNALEVRSLRRSGPTKIPAVQRARDAFFGQAIFREREIWDRGLFDGDRGTAFSVDLRFGDQRVKGGAFRLDLGEVRELDELVLETFDEAGLQPLKSEEGVVAEVSADLVTWRELRFLAGKTMTLDLRRTGPWRYLRFAPGPLRLREVRGVVNGREVDRTKWRASNLFAPWIERHWAPGMVHRARAAWSGAFTLNEISPGGYLCVAVNGVHGRERAAVAFRIDGKLVGAPDRSPSFPSNAWEVPPRSIDRNNTFYLPLRKEWAGKQIEAVVLAFDPERVELQPEVWVTAYPTPFAQKTLVLEW